MRNHRKSITCKRQKKMRIAAVVFLLPAVLFLLVYIFYPMIETFRISLYRWNGISADKTFTGLDNWSNLMADKDFWGAFRNSVLIMAISVCIQIPLGLKLATFLEFAGRKGRIFRFLWMLPLVMSAAATGLLFRYVWAMNGGLISGFSKLFGGNNINFLGDSKYALYAAGAALGWQLAPFYMVYFSALYAKLPSELYQAAVIDGAGKGQYFIQIAMPVIKPSLKYAMLLSIAGSLKYFDLIYVMTGGGPGSSTEVMTTYMYKYSFAKWNLGYGAATAAGMFLIIVLVMLFVRKLIGERGEMD